MAVVKVAASVATGNSGLKDETGVANVGVAYWVGLGYGAGAPRIAGRAQVAGPLASSMMSEYTVGRDGRVYSGARRLRTSCWGSQLESNVGMSRTRGKREPARL